jgi:alkylation response protein AidB-like acyl-CoA dehydrogenase
MTDAALLDAALALAQPIRSRADEAEAERRLPADVVEALADAGLFRMLVPKALGGGEVGPATMIRAIEAVATADGAAGWCVMAAATTGLVSAYLEEEAAREVYGDPRAVTSGVFAPTGKAVDEGDHYRVSGRWSFASGVDHAAYRVVGVLLMGEAGPVLGPGGEPAIRHMILRADQTRVVDTWHVSGLRGTGSHDMTAEDSIVPKRLVASLIAGRPRHEGLVYRFPFFGLLSLGVAAVALGVARDAIGALVALAAGKRPMWSKKSLAHRELVQAHVAEAEGLVRAARAFLFEAAAEVSDMVSAQGGEVGTRERALLRLAATQATRSCARAVDLMYNAGGGSSIYATSPLQRCFRDVHAATQHAMVAEATYAVSGRVLLGLESGTDML